jgi:hypothetical protein
MLLLAVIAWLVLSGCGKAEFASDDFGVGSCVRSRHIRNDIIVKVVNHTAYKGWIVETENGERFTLPFNTPDLEAVPCE